jgi:hypothetical protein
MYGTTYSGGNFGVGSVFKLAPNADGSWTETVLHSFAGPEGCYPMSGLIFDAAGNLYGLTSYCGASGFAGTVFKLAPQSDGSWADTVLYDFCSVENCADGIQPRGAVLYSTRLEISTARLLMVVAIVQVAAASRSSYRRKRTGIGPTQCFILLAVSMTVPTPSPVWSPMHRVGSTARPTLAVLPASVSCSN